MKKLGIAFILTAISLMVGAQTSTLKDYGNKYKIQWDYGDTLTITKGNLHVENDGTTVFLVVGQDRNDPKPFASLDPADFGYASAHLLDAFITSLNSLTGFTERLNKATNPDSIFYLYGTDTISWRKLTYNANDSLLVFGDRIPW